MANPVMHFEIMATGDVAATRTFYSEVFGWKVAKTFPNDYSTIETGGPGINGGIGKPMHGPGYQTFYIHVDDLEQTLRKIEQRGGSRHMPPTDVPDAGITIAMFKDPAGNMIGLVTGTGPE